jgi:hypothetical protein
VISTSVKIAVVSIFVASAVSTLVYFCLDSGYSLGLANGIFYLGNGVLGLCSSDAVFEMLRLLCQCAQYI